MSDDITLTELSHDDLTAIVDKHVAWLDEHEPSWRSELADCCLHCSDVPWGEPMRRLDALQTAWWMLGGGTHSEFVAEFGAPS